jgi:hypothetical protein
MSGTLAPADTETSAFIAKLKFGQGVTADVKRARNILFHRKMFALFKLAYELWDAPKLEYKGQQVAKNFDRFRKDVTVLAGFYEAVTNFRGEVRLEAKSLAFHAMGEAEFEDVYNAVLGVMWVRILKAVGYKTPEAVDVVVQELLRFE